ncbi:MAG: hypothetical protein ACQEP7_04445 [bacterium]
MQENWYIKNNVAEKNNNSPSLLLTVNFTVSHAVDVTLSPLPELHMLLIMYFRLIASSHLRLFNGFPLFPKLNFPSSPNNLITGFKALSPLPQLSCSPFLF